MRALKDKGLEDLNEVRKRARLMFAHDRIQEDELRRLEDVLNEAEAVIVNMSELDATGNEIGGEM